MTSSAIYMLIHSMYELSGKFPSVEDICRKTGCNKNDIQNVLNHFVKINRLRFENGEYSFINERKKSRLMFNICRAIMAIVAISCILCSIRFTYTFNKLTMPKVWGFILSASMIVFTSFCFTVREYLLNQNKIKQAKLFVGLYIMGVTYSIFTAVAGQYNDYLIQNKNTVQIRLNNAVNDRTIELLEEQKKSYFEQIENYELQIKSQQKIIDNLSESPERKYEYNNTWTNSIELINGYNTKIQELQNEIKIIDSKLIESVNIENDEDKNIYDWLAKLFHINAGMIQFLISLFPAIFIDLITPFAINFAFIDKSKN